MHLADPPLLLMRISALVAKCLLDSNHTSSMVEKFGAVGSVSHKEVAFGYQGSARSRSRRRNSRRTTSRHSQTRATQASSSGRSCTVMCPG